MDPRFKYPNIGSISTGTVRNRDLIPLFHTALECINDDGREQAAEIYSCYIRTGENFPDDDDPWWDTAEAEECLSKLFDALDSLAPPYCYFGAHEGDGSDYGFWPCIDRLEEAVRDDDNVIKVSDLSEVPPGFMGYVMHVSDHGNVTLYKPLCEPYVEYQEVWSVV